MTNSSDLPPLNVLDEVVSMVCAVRDTYIEGRQDGWGRAKSAAITGFFASGIVLVGSLDAVFHVAEAVAHVGYHARGMDHYLVDCGREGQTTFFGRGHYSLSPDKNPQIR